VDQNGIVATTSTYSVWGVATTIGNATITDKSFTGQDASENTGLIFYQSRWYDPCNALIPYIGVP
jgi:hypothetical protein